MENLQLYKNDVLGVYNYLFPLINAPGRGATLIRDEALIRGRCWILNNQSNGIGDEGLD